MAPNDSDSTKKRNHISSSGSLPDLDLLQHGGAEAEVDPGVGGRVEGGQEGQDHQQGVNVASLCKLRTNTQGISTAMGYKVSSRLRESCFKAPSGCRVKLHAT